MYQRKDQLSAFNRLLDIMDTLREKCPWDQKQTMESLRHLTIEETYELADAILDNDTQEVKKELGDLLLHIVFYAKIGAEQKEFDIADVANTIADKLIHRHPHIYGDVTVTSEEDVKKNWEALKLKEGRTSVLEGVPKSLPALVKASRIQEKVAGVGFEWKQTSQAFDKLQEELEELRVEVEKANKEQIEAEFGDALFALINYGRFLGISAENALERTNKKFTQRFQYIEKTIATAGGKIQDTPLSEMETLWNLAKTVSKPTSL